MNAADFLREIVTALDKAGIPHMLTGSFASSLHGSPRATQDLDIVIAPSRESLEKLLAMFPPGPRYYVDKDAALDAFERKSQFQIVSAEDLILAKLEWAAAGGSQRQIEDAAGVVRIQRGKLDEEYLSRGIRELGLETEWEKTRKLASPAP